MTPRPPRFLTGLHRAALCLPLSARPRISPAALECFCRLRQAAEVLPPLEPGVPATPDAFFAGAAGSGFAQLVGR